jgi:hypothetical protein
VALLPVDAVGADAVSRPRPEAGFVTGPTATLAESPIELSARVTNRRFVRWAEVPVASEPTPDAVAPLPGAEDAEPGGPPPRPLPFPFHTVLGAGIGAVIGHQSGQRSAGAWIGGGIGLALDLQRWSR